MALKEPIPRGKRLRCPKCQTAFAAEPVAGPRAEPNVPSVSDLAPLEIGEYVGERVVRECSSERLELRASGWIAPICFIGGLALLAFAFWLTWEVISVLLGGKQPEGGEFVIPLRSIAGLAACFLFGLGGVVVAFMSLVTDLFDGAAGCVKRRRLFGLLRWEVPASELSAIALRLDEPDEGAHQSCILVLLDRSAKDCFSFCYDEPRLEEAINVVRAGVHIARLMHLPLRVEGTVRKGVTKEFREMVRAIASDCRLAHPDVSSPDTAATF